MKIIINKTQWQSIGKQAGWAENEKDENPGFQTELGEVYLKGWDSKQDHIQGSWKMLNPELKNSIKGRAFLLGWNNFSQEAPRQIPSNLFDQVKSDY